MESRTPPKPEPPQSSVKAILAEMERSAGAQPVRPAKPPAPWRSSLSWKIAIGAAVAVMFIPLLLHFVPDAPMGSQYEGYLDETDEVAVIGWAWDAARPDKAINVEIDDGVHPKVVVLADRARGDLKEAGKGNGKHGFRYLIPSSARDGRTHTVTVRYADTQRPLDNSPRIMIYAKSSTQPAQIR